MMPESGQHEQVDLLAELFAADKRLPRSHYRVVSNLHFYLLE
jgi:hypothetical protein